MSIAYEIKNILGFAGEGEATLVWGEPLDSDNVTNYFYNRYDAVGGNSGWIPLGSKEVLKSINLGGAGANFLLYKFNNLTNDTVYTYRIAAASLGSSDIFLDANCISTYITPSSIKNGEPSPERLMRGLDTSIFKTSSDSTLYKIFYILAIHIRDFYLDLGNEALPQLNILTSTGEYVDNWGFLFGMNRQRFEPDQIYAARIVKGILIEKCTPQGIIKALTPYSVVGVPVQVIDGSKDYTRFVFDASVLGGPPTADGVSLDFDPYAIAGYIPGTPVGFVEDGVLTYSPLFGDTFGGIGLDSFSFIVRLRPIAIGSPATTANTLSIVSEILRKYHMAGTSFEIQTI